MSKDKITETVNKPYDPEKDPEAKTGTDQYPRVERKKGKNEKIFDIMLGIVLPILLFIADPIVFKSSFLDRPLLINHVIFAYLGAFIAIVALVLWLIFQPKHILICGFLSWGVLFSFYIGVLIFLPSLMGIMFFGIGLFGLTPFVTAYVYIKHAYRSFKRSQYPNLKLVKVFIVLLVMVIIFFGCWTAQKYVNDTIEESIKIVISGDDTKFDSAVDKLCLLKKLANLDELVMKYEEITDEDRKGKIAQAYKKITGEDIQITLDELRD